MSSTLVAEYAEEQVLEAGSDSQPPVLSREFCPVCYTDSVSVRADGVIYCPECGNTSGGILG